MKTNESKGRSTMQDLVNKLSGMSTHHLQAIYNNAWRNAHNGVNEEAARFVMAGVEFVCGLRRVEIAGRGGSWEFVQR